MMGRNKLSDALIRNKAAYNVYFEKLYSLAVTSFNYSNMPMTVDIDMMEKFLCENGCCVFFEDEVLGYLSLQTMINGPLNVYREPEKNTAYAVNGYRQRLNQGNSVIIWNNVTRSPTINIISQYAERLANLDRIIEINANSQKTPVVFLCDETQRLTMKNLMMQWDGNEPFIFGSKNLDIKDIQVLKSDAPFNGDKLYNLKYKYWTEALAYLGIDNAEFEKSERVNTGEVKTMKNNIGSLRQVRLRPRQLAIQKINAMFGLNIKVEFNPLFVDSISAKMEVNVNEQIYDTTDE